MVSSKTRNLGDEVSVVLNKVRNLGTKGSIYFQAKHERLEKSLIFFLKVWFCQVQ
ncbi:MAG: hypothetical protein LBD03_08770 [Methanobrevibacter sp.]|nr:hypothetical protein [Candidatus Methanovirga procula]